MFNKLFLVLAAVMCINAAPCAAENNNNNQEVKVMADVSISDYEGVKAAINKYLEAGKQGKSEIAKPAFHKDAIIYSSPKGTIEGGAIQSLFDYFDNNPAAPQIAADISVVEIAGNVAYAKVESDNWHGARYTDMFLLLKEGNEWKILTKVFHTH